MSSSTNTGDRGYRHRREWREGERATEAVLAALSEAGVDFEEQSTPMIDFFDPEALDRLLSGVGGEGVRDVRVRLWGHEITVTDEAVVVEE
jgi:hypothetical protein